MVFSTYANLYSPCLFRLSALYWLYCQVCYLSLELSPNSLMTPILSGVLIGSSFVFKKKGLLASQAGGEAGQGVAYLKSVSRSNDSYGGASV